jgi:hypothetical protein
MKCCMNWENKKNNISGRSAQKIRLLIFKIAKTAETLATPTSPQLLVMN